MVSEELACLVIAGRKYSLLSGGRAYTDCTEEFLSMVDVLVDGRFIQELYDISLLFRGSSNQRLIDLKKSKKSGGIVLYDSP